MIMYSLQAAMHVCIHDVYHWFNTLSCYHIGWRSLQTTVQFKRNLVTKVQSVLPSEFTLAQTMPSSYKGIYLE